MAWPAGEAYWTEVCVGGYYSVCMSGNSHRLHILLAKKIHIFFFPSLPQVLSVLYQGTGSDFPYYHPHRPSNPCIFDWRHPCQSAHVKGGESLWVSFSTGEWLDRLVLKCGSSSALLSESLPVSVGTGSVELSNGSRSVFNHTTLCRIDRAAELRSDYWWVSKVYFISIKVIRSVVAQFRTLLFPRCEVTKGTGWSLPG